MSPLPAAVEVSSELGNGRTHTRHDTTEYMMAFRKGLWTRI
jgi:hypothetical protein